jgi:hypothetical protein
MTPSLVVLAVIFALWMAAPPAYAHGAVSIDTYSQGTPHGGASAGASITATNSEPGQSGSPGASSASSGGGSEDIPVSSGAPQPELRLFSHPVEPRGPGSSWYINENLHECIALPGGGSECLEEGEGEAVAPNAHPARPAISPEAVAVTISDRLNLSVGGIVASPSAQTAGLTGAASWFWIEPTPTARSVSVSLGGEHVTVSATAASARWSFGDGSQLLAGPGVPYRPGAAPADAVRHVYQTRCLPGDQGHDPNVLSSCGPDGYTVEALVQWSISYTASGPVAGGGSLPSRSTATSIAYPVSEARAFLTAGGGQ